MFRPAEAAVVEVEAAAVPWSPLGLGSALSACMTLPLLSAAQLASAAELLAPVAVHTPLELSRTLSDRLGVPVLLKCENLQRTGSFKLRGAYVRLARLSEAERAAGVLAASAGNHAQGVALAAHLLGISATVLMPTGASLTKVAATAGYGAQVELLGASVDEAIAHARARAERTGEVFVHPFDHDDVLAGQASVGSEILRDLPEVSMVVVPAGGGGLVAGIAAAVAAQGSAARVVAAQPEGVATLPDSLRGRAPVRASVQTIADGVAIAAPGVRAVQHLRELSADCVLVSDDLIARSMLLLAERAKLVTEPAGAVGVAALLSGQLKPTGPVVAVLSGGNVDPLTFAHLLEHGLDAAGRFHTLTVTLADQPGALAGLLSVVAGAGANVREVSHLRHGQALAVGQVQVALAVETHSDEHFAAVQSAVRKVQG